MCSHPLHCIMFRSYRTTHCAHGSCLPKKGKKEKISSQGSQGTLPPCVGGVRDRRVWTDTPSHKTFFSTLSSLCTHHIVAQGVSVRISLHPHAIHDVTCLSVRLLSLRVCLFPVSLSLLPCLFHSLPVLCPAHHLQCRHRRGLKTTALTHNEGVLPRGDIQSSHTEEDLNECLVRMGQLIRDTAGATCVVMRHL